MKKIFLLATLVLGFFSQAQFTISGEIKNFNEEVLLVRIYDGANDKIINKITTDKSGKFSVNIPESYHGMINISDRSKQNNINILTDNADVSFLSEFENNLFLNTQVTKGKTAIAYEEYQSFESYKDLKSNVFPIIKALYNSKDPFYQAIVKEENRIDGLKANDNLPLLQYFIQLNKLANVNFEQPEIARTHQQNILKHLMNDNTYLESSGLMGKLVMDYLRTSIVNATSQQQINEIIKTEIDTLLDKIELDTPRGQNVLSAIFHVLPAAQFGELLAPYYDKANALTCELTDELKLNLSAHNLKKPGSIVPNIQFDQSVKGYQSLYDIKTDKKIILFWASWCPACMNEMAFVKEFYHNFKKEGGEIIAISLDYEEPAYTAAIKDSEWVNYTELLQWDTQGVEAYGVSSTPTFFLVDKDNKLIKKANHISELIDY